MHAYSHTYIEVWEMYLLMFPQHIILYINCIDHNIIRMLTYTAEKYFPHHLWGI